MSLPTRIRSFADFEAREGDRNEEGESRGNEGSKEREFSISYTINLNLPPTTNVEVFNAIFRSLKENLLRED